MSDEYFTVKGSAQHTIVVKKSKFISNVLPVENQDEAEKNLDAFRKKYWDATHNVYAYIIGLNDEIQKCSDDGEPAGTAGKPVLEVIKSRTLKNVMVVVTRYFGGILLGAGGLIRAYGDSAAAGLHEAGIVKRIKYDIYEVKIDYSQLGRLQWEIKQKGLIISNADFAANVVLKVCVPVSFTLNFKDFIMNITSGIAELKRLDQVYM